MSWWYFRTGFPWTCASRCLGEVRGPTRGDSSKCGVKLSSQLASVSLKTPFSVESGSSPLVISKSGRGIKGGITQVSSSGFSAFAKVSVFSSSLPPGFSSFSNPFSLSSLASKPPRYHTVTVPSHFFFSSSLFFGFLDIFFNGVLFYFFFGYCFFIFA